MGDSLVLWGARDGPEVRLAMKGSEGIDEGDSYKKLRGKKG